MGLETQSCSLVDISTLLKNAELGDGAAQCQLAIEYRDGKHIDQDLEQALYWLQQSASNDYTEAHYLLSQFYEQKLQLLPRSLFYQIVFKPYQRGAMFC